MLKPQSVKTRHRAMHDFKSCYEQLCCLQSTTPLQLVKAHLNENVLDINGDKIRMLDWAPILDSIKINKSLRLIAIRSFFQVPSSASAKKLHYFKRKTPAICVKDVTQWIAASLRSCLAASSTIKSLDLQGIPLRERDIALLSKGIETNLSLSYVSLNYCQIADKGLKIFCHAVRSHPCITHISLCGCNITSCGTEEIAKLIKHQSTLRHSEAWADSLRYRTPNFNCMGGIRRITVNANPMIGDDGILPFTEALKDDLWVKALDFQQCGISSKGALTLLEAMQYNNTLVVLDLRQNPMVDSTTLRTVLGRVLMNANESDEVAYPWVKEEAPKDPYCTKKYRPPKGTNKSFGRKGNGRMSRGSIDGTQIKFKTAPRYKSSLAWQAAVQTSQVEKEFRDDTIAEEETIVFHLEPNKLFDSMRVSVEKAPKVINRSVLVNESQLNLNESQAFIRQLKVDILNAQRKLEAAAESEKILNNKILALEVENARLKKDLATSFENSRVKSQLEDDLLLDSIEQSFNKFHEFLNRLHDVGLGSLASAAGLEKDMLLPASLPLHTPNDKTKPSPRVQKTIENDQHMPVSNPIVIQASSKLKEQNEETPNVQESAPHNDISKQDVSQPKEKDDEAHDAEAYESSFESTSDSF